MKEKSLLTRVYFRVEPDLKERFETEAKKRGDSSKLIRALMDAYLRRCETSPLPELPLTVKGSTDL